MSESEDFLLQIDAEELFPQEFSSTKKREKKTRKKKKRKKKMKINKLHPNHFIAFQIYDSVIRKKIADLQSKIITTNPLLKKALIDIKTLHVTLAVTHLANDEHLKELQERLQDWGNTKMKEHFSDPIHLTFKGIGTFQKNVAFAKINECENYRRLCNLSKDVNNLLTNAGFYSESDKHFTPHLTLLKLSKCYKFFKDKKNISDDFERLTQCDDDFGSQDIQDIQLLSMVAKKDDDGYYKRLWQVHTKSIQSCASDSIGGNDN